MAETTEDTQDLHAYTHHRYPTMSKTLGNFKLHVVEGEFTDSQIIVMLGENGTGKSTFIRMLVSLLALAYLTQCFPHGPCLVRGEMIFI